MVDEFTFQETFDGPPTGEIRLFSRRAVVWSTFLGSPLAGGILMALNYKRLGRSPEIGKTLRWTGLFTVVVLIAAASIPDNVSVPAAVIAAPQLFLMGWFYTGRQKQMFDQHLKEGGRKASILLATAIGFAGTVVVVCTFLGAEEILWMRHGKVLGHPLGNQVYYKDGATRSDAKEVANELREFGWFESFPMEQAQVRREDGRLEVAIIVNVDALDDSDVVDYFNELGSTFASSSLGPSIRLKLCDTPFVSNKSLDFGNDDSDNRNDPTS